MNTIPAQDIKQRGISAVDELLKNGPVHVITRNRPQYVVLDEEQYEELVEAQHEAYIARVKAALADVAAGRVYRFDTTEEAMEAIRNFDEDAE